MDRLIFPSRAWCEAAASALHEDPEARAALVDFGPVVAGVVIERGAGLESDFCVLIKLAPGKRAEVRYCQDEDELEEMEPDYIAWVPHGLCKEFLRAALGGEQFDPLRRILNRQIRLRGDLQRLVRQAGKHRTAGLLALRALPTQLVD